MTIPPPPPPPSASPLVFLSPHQAPHPTHRSLHHSYTVLQSQLRLQPPFSLSITDDYADLTQAIAYGILTDSRRAKVHLTHLHSIVVDGYCLFTSTLVSVVDDLYPALLDESRVHLLWALSNLTDVAAVGLENLVVALLRRINGGDFSGNNMWLAGELLTLFIAKWDWILEEMKDVLVCGLFVFLRLLADHYRLRGDEKLKLLKKMEVDFCIRLFREHFDLCLGIGRDLIRLLQEVVFIPEFRDVWRDLISDPGVFGVPWFKNLGQIYQTRTPRRFFLLRVNVEIETQLRFMLTNVKWGSQMRYQKWFSKAFLCRPEQETVLADLIRFVCCVCCLDDKVSGPGVISRWAVIGWLLKSCKKNYFEANAKLSLFYDWLFFDEKVDDVMNIEPAALLMVHSLPKYPDLTNMMMEFLFLLVDNYDTSKKDMIAHSVSESFKILVKTRSVSSLLPLASESRVAPVLRNRMNIFLSCLSLIEPSELRNPVINCLESCFDVVKKHGKHLKVTTTEESGFSVNKSKANHDSDSPPSSRTKLNKESSILNSLESLKESSTPFIRLTVPWNLESSGALDSGVSKKPRIFFEVSDRNTEGVSRQSKALDNLIKVHEVGLQKSEAVNIELGHESLTLSKPKDVIKSPVFGKPEFVVESPMLSKMEATKESYAPTTHLSQKDLKILAKHDSDDTSDFNVLENLVEDLGVKKTDNNEFSQESFPFSKSEDANKSPNISKLELLKESASLITDNLEGTKESSVPSAHLSQNVPEISADHKIINNSEIANRESIQEFFSSNKPEVDKNSLALSKPDAVKKTLLQGMSESANKGSSTSNTEIVIPTHLKVSSSCGTSTFDAVKNLVEGLELTVKQSIKSGVKSLLKLLTLFASLDVHELGSELGGNSSTVLQALASQITEAFNSVGHGMFRLNSRPRHKKHSDDEIHSATAIVLQAYIFCPHERMRGLLYFWSGNRYPVGACLLSYACRLAYEARMLRRSRNVKTCDVEKTLLHHHIAGYRTLNREASSSEVSIETMDSKFIKELVDGAFVAYRRFLISSVTDRLAQAQQHGETESMGGGYSEMINQDLSSLVFSDILSGNMKTPQDFQSIFAHLSDLSTSRIEFIQMVVDIINPVNIVYMQYEISLKQFSMFGKDPCSICKIVISSLGWKSSKQKKLWSLLPSEIMVNNIKVEEMVFNLCTTCIDPVLHSVAMEGLFMLIRVCSPTSEFIHLLMTLPKSFGDFAAAVLCCWAFNSSSGSLFGTSLTKWLQKLDEKQCVFSSSKNCELNHFVVGSVLELLDKFSMSPSDFNIPEVKGKLLYLITKNKDNNIVNQLSV